MYFPSSSIGAFPFLQALLPLYDISNLQNVNCWYEYQFHSSSVWTEEQKLTGPMFSVFFMEKNETEEKLAAAHVLFELLIVGRNFILSMTLHSYNIK